MMLHKIQNEYLTVTAAEKGAELQSILGQDGTEYLWQGDSAYWADRALNLFPYVARLKDGVCYMDGEKCEMEIHGLAPYCDFALVSHSEDRMVLELTDNEETRRRYPRRFAFRVIYTLKERTLEVTFEVENRDERIMRFGIGGHPGFNVPLVKGKKFEDYRLRFSEPCVPERVIFGSDCLVTGERRTYPLAGGDTIALSHDMFDEDAVVLAGMASSVTLETDGDPHAVTVTYPQMPYLGIWHWPKKDAPYVCLEPWVSLPASSAGVTVLEEQKDLVVLSGGETYRNVWTISIS